MTRREPHLVQNLEETCQNLELCSKAASEFIILSLSTVRLGVRRLARSCVVVRHSAALLVRALLPLAGSVSRCLLLAWYSRCVAACLLLAWCSARRTLRDVLTENFCLDHLGGRSSLREGPEESFASLTMPVRKALVHNATSHGHKDEKDYHPHQAKAALRIARKATVRLDRIEVRVEAHRTSWSRVAVRTHVSSVRGVQYRTQPASGCGI